MNKPHFESSHKDWDVTRDFSLKNFGMRIVKRLTGVKKPTFAEMVAILEEMGDHCGHNMGT